ncbi:MAG: CPBP family intramembrane metalloprotease [Prevotella sp.]|nr:CPBP family intramembrane metalloprotease [Prevotella sp.]
MNAYLKAALETVLYIVVYLLLQVVCAACLKPLHLFASQTVVFASGISAIIAVVLFVALHWSAPGTGLLRARPAALLLWTCVLAAALLLPLQYLEDLFTPAMPDRFADMFEASIRQPGGYLVFCIIGPIAEETVFRGAVLRKLLSLNCRMWVAIVVSAVIFGAVHGNLAQFSHAFIMGLLLGWLYARTRSIWPCVAIHWVNNSLAYTITRLFPGHADDSIIELFGGNTPLLCLSLAVSTLLAALALWRVIVAVEKYRCRW